MKLMVKRSATVSMRLGEMGRNIDHLLHPDHHHNDEESDDELASRDDQEDIQLATTMGKWTLYFHDPEVEKGFREHYKKFIVPRQGMGLRLLFLTISVMTLTEWYFGFTEGAVEESLLLRALTLGCLFLTHCLMFFPSYPKHSDVVMLVTYTLVSTLLVTQYAIMSAMGTALDQTSTKLYFFAEGRWSLPMSLIFVAVGFHAAGLRLVLSTAIALVHWLSGVILTWSVFFEDAKAKSSGQAAIMPALAIMCGVSAYSLEKHIREDFALRCTIAQERRVRDEIVHSMLPPAVSKKLAEGCMAEEVVQSYSGVTILFGYVTGFKELTTSTQDEELVAFINKLFSNFDIATEYHDVYKLEAIEASFLCCAGAPDTDESQGIHSDRIVQMAMTMLAIANNSRLPSVDGEPGQIPEMKIGIHTGPVVGGVTGHKSYSYHLFGDTVNTSSRMGSTGDKNRIQLSKAAYDSLSGEMKKRCIARGGVQVKGKGNMETYWVDSSASKRKRRYSAFLSFKTLRRMFDPNLKNLTINGDGNDDDGGFDRIRVKSLRFQLKSSSQDGEEDSEEANDLHRQLEAEYILQYDSSRLVSFQRFLVLAMVFSVVSLYLDLWSRDDAEIRTVVAMRVGSLSVVGCTLAVTTYSRFIRFMQPIGAATAVLFSLTQNSLILIVDEFHMMDANIVVVIGVSLLMGLRFQYVAAVNFSIAVIYTTFLLASNFSSDAGTVISFMLFCYCTTFLGTNACYTRERELRYDFLHKRILSHSKAKSEVLLKNMLPNVAHLNSLMSSKRIMDHLEDVTVLYSDLKGYTGWCSQESPSEVYRVLNRIYGAFDSHLEPLGVYKLDTIGDAFVVVGGLDGFKSVGSHATAMVKLAFRMLYELDRIKAEEGLNFEMRVGIHTGSAIGSVIGTKKPRYLCWGKTPLIANELEAEGKPGKVLVSSATFQRLSKVSLLEMGVKFRPCESITLKTRSGTESISTFRLEMEGLAAITMLQKQIRLEQSEEATAEAATEVEADTGGQTSMMSVKALAKLKHVLTKSKSPNSPTGGEKRIRRSSSFSDARSGASMAPISVASMARMFATPTPPPTKPAEGAAKAVNAFEGIKMKTIASEQLSQTLPLSASASPKGGKKTTSSARRAHSP
ncbi:unnamed protein product [Chrysoparadoxa australica]